MEKINADSWTGPPISVTSTFSVDLGSNGRKASAICGFGWQFAASVSGSGVGSSSSARSPTVTLEFSPNLIKSASFGSLAILIGRISNRNRIECQSTSIYLPAGSDWHSLGQFAVQTDEKLHVEITVTISDHPELPIPSLSQTILQSLSQSITNSEFVDTKFYLFSRRETRASSDAEPTTIATTPRPVFANSRVLTQSAEYFTSLLQGGFKGSPFVDFETFVPKTSSLTYDYVESDSDLDDDSDSEAEVAEQSGTEKEKEEGDILANEATSHSLIPANHIGRVIELDHWAYRTWMTLIHYLYSGNVTFSTIGSRQRKDQWSCSPKSMYRFAHEVEHETLKCLSLQAIQRQLTVHNIVNEVFSSFTARYDDVLDIETTFFCDNIKSSPHLTETFQNYLCDNNHNPKVLVSIFQKLTGGLYSNPAPPSESPESSLKRRKKRGLLSLGGFLKIL